MPKYLSGRSKVTPLTGLSSDRYRYLSVSDAEPNLGDPLVGPSSIGAKPLESGFQYQIVAVEGRPGERYWQPVQAQQVVPGSISVFEEGVLVGGVSSTTQLDFRGTAITAEGLGGANPGYAVTITFAPPGNEKEVIFKQSNDFATDSTFTFDSSINLLSAGDRLTVGAGGTVITTTGAGFVGIGTTNPTGDLTTNYDPNLHVEGNIRLTGTIIDRLGDAGDAGFLLVKEDDIFGGLSWTDPANITFGGAGDYRQVQFKGSTGLLEGADFLYYDEVNNFVGIGSTQPTVRLDVIGKSNFDGDVIIERNLSVGGISTFTQFIDANGGLDVFGQTDLDALNASGLINFTNTTNNTLGNPNTGAVQIDGGVGINQNVSIGGGLDVDGNTTVDALTASELVSFTNTTNNTLGNPNTGAVQIDGGVGINQNVSIGGGLDVDGNTELDDLNVSGTATIQTLNLTSLQLQNLKVTGIATFDQQVNINNLSVTGVATVDNIKIDTNTVSTLSGNIIIDSSAGTTQINDALYVNDATESTSKDTGSVIVEGGVGIEKNLNVGGAVSFTGDGVGVDVILASAGGITTTGGDLYVGGDAYIDQSLNLTDIVANTGTFNVSLTSASLTLDNPGIAVTAILDEDDMISNRDDALATQQSIKAYVDAQVGNQDLDFSGDTGTGSVDLDTQVFDVSGVTGDIVTSAIGHTLTIASDVTGVIAGTYGSSTQVGIITVNDKGKITAASNVNIKFEDASVGTADSLTNPRQIEATGDITWGVSFKGHEDVSGIATLKDVITAGTVGSATQVGVVTFDSKGRIIEASNVNIKFEDASVGTADSLTNPRQIEATGDITWGVSFKGHEDVSGIATLSNTGVTSATYGSPTEIPVISVDAKGRITSAGTTTVDASGGGGGDADRVSTGSTNGTGDYFLTFVDFNNDPRSAEYLYTDCALVYNPSTDQLTITGGLNVTNNVTLGDSSSDTLTVNASVGSTIIPDTTDFYDLGSSASLRWKTVYAQTICANNYCGATIIGSADNVGIATTDGTEQPYNLTFVSGTSGNKPIYVDGNCGLQYCPTTCEMSLGSNLLICDNASLCIGDSKEFNMTYRLIDVNNLPSPGSPILFGYDSCGCYNGTGTGGSNALDRYDVSGNKIASSGKGAIFEEVGSGPVLLRALGSGEGAFQFFSTNSNDPGDGSVVPDPENWVSLLKMHGGRRGFRLFQCDANLEVVNVTGAGVTVAGNIVPWVGLNPQENGRRSCTTSLPLTNNFQTFTSGTFNLGSPTNKWDTVYANNICATSITGSASQVSVATTNATENPYYFTFVACTGDEELYVDDRIRLNYSQDKFVVETNLKVYPNKFICVGSDADHVSLTYCCGDFACGTAGNLNRCDSSNRIISTTGKGIIFDDNGGGPTIFKGLGDSAGGGAWYFTNEDWQTAFALCGGGGATFYQDATEILGISRETCTGINAGASIKPSLDSTYDLGTNAIRWRTIYADTVCATNITGTISGGATQINTQCTTTNGAYYLTFVDGNNSSPTAETLYTNSIIHCKTASGSRNYFQVDNTCIKNYGSSNVIIGESTVGNCVTSNDNVLLGAAAGRYFTSGGSNVMIGSQAGGATACNACRNVFLGSYAGQFAGCVPVGTPSGAVSNNIAIGYLSGCALCANNSIFLGASAGKTGNHDSSIVIGQCTASNSNYSSTKRHNIFLGAYAAFTSCDNIEDSIVIGKNASRNIQSTIFKSNIVIGNDSALNIRGTPQSNIIIGTGAAYNSNLCNIGSCNLVMGHSSGRNNLVGSNNIFLGNNAGSSQGGSCNVFIGYVNGTCANTGDCNTAIGYPISNIVFSGTTCRTIFIGPQSAAAAYVGASWTVCSDIRSKCVWGSVPHGREFLRGVNPIKFSFKDQDTNEIVDDNIRYGFSAQEIIALEGEEQVIARKNSYDDHYITHDYMLPVLVNAIKELDTENTNLKQRLIAVEQCLGISS